MKVAVFSDVHGNVAALEAVLADIDRRGVDALFCAGDLVSYGPYPNEAVDVIRQRGIPAVRGNHDDAVGFGKPSCGCWFVDETDRLMGEAQLAWTAARVTQERKEFLRGLPLALDLDWEGYRVLITHGSPRSVHEYVREDTPTGELEQLVAASGADVLIVGHTHRPFYRLFGARHLVNAGSAGKPKHGRPGAIYVLLEMAPRAGDNRPAGRFPELIVRFVEVPYDVEATARALEASGLPAGYAHRLRSGRG